MEGMFEWKPQYSVSLPSIDGQHQNLFRLAEELFKAMTAGQGKSVISTTLDRLVQYTIVHFAHEERLLSQHHYPDLASHVAEHRTLTKKVLSFQKDFDDGKVFMTVEVLEFLKEWLKHHIAETDQRYVPYLKERAVA